MRERLSTALRAIGRWGWDAAGIVAAIAYALPSLWYPFAGDQGLHWYLGKGILLGEIPYTNAVSTKPPLVFVVHAVSLALLGDHQHAIRVFDLIFVLATGVLVATFRRRIRAAGDARPHTLPAIEPGTVGAACLLASCLYYTFFDFNDTAHPTLWSGVLLLASAWVVVRAPGHELSGRAAFASGALACCAVQLGYDAAIGGAVLGASVVALGLLGRRPWEALRSGAAFTAGVVAIVALTMLPFVLTGTFDSYWNVTFEFVALYVERAPAAGGTIPPWMRMDYGGPSVILALALWTTGVSIAGATRNRSEQKIGWWSLLLALTAFGIVAAKGRAFISPAFNYYFMSALPFMALLAHWGLRQALPRRGAHQIAAAAALTAAAFFLAPKWGTHRDWSYRAEWNSWRSYVRGERSFDEYHAAHYRSVVDAFARQHRVGAMLRELADEGDTMCADGFVPVLYHLTQLRCTSRAVVGDIAGPRSPLYAEHQRAEREDPPTFIVTFSDRRPRLRELQLRGYVRHDVDDGRQPHYVIFERGER